MDKTIVLMNMKIKNEKKTTQLKMYRTVTSTNHTTAATPPRPLKNKLSTHGTLGAKNMDGIIIQTISFEM